MQSAHESQSLHPSSRLPFVGRRRERELLQRQLIDAGLGYGSLVLIAGEAGIGKTALATQLRQQAESAGFAVVTGNAFPGEVPPPYGLWREGFEQASNRSDGCSIPELADLARGTFNASTQQEFLSTTVATLADISRNVPLFVLLEDIQWADSGTLELLRYLGRRVRSMRILLTATYRQTDEQSGSSLLETRLPDIVRESNAIRVTPPRLDRAEVDELVQRSYSLSAQDGRLLVEYLYNRAEGHPLFTGELLHELESSATLETLTDGSWTLGAVEHRPVPDFIRQLILARAANIDHSAGKLLDLAAVIGHEVPIELWRAAAQVESEVLAETIEELQRIRLLEDSNDGSSVRFTHGLVQEAIYGRSSRLRRQQQHRMIAELLERRSDPTPEMVARHFSSAGDERAIPWFIEAGRRALQVYAPQDAVHSLSSAIENSIARGQEPVPEALRLRARGLEMLGRFEDANADLEQMYQQAVTNGDNSAAWQALHDLGLLKTATDYGAAGVHLQRALELARNDGDMSWIGHSLNRLGNWLANTGSYSEALALHQESLDAFEQLGDESGIADTLDLLGSTSYLAGNYKEAIAFQERSIALSRTLGDRVRLVSSLATLAACGGDLDVSFDAGTAASRPSQAWVAFGEEALQTARDIGWQSGVAFAQAMLGGVLAVRGEFGRALDLLEGSHELSRQIGHQQWLAASALQLSGIWNELFDPGRAVLFAERGRAIASELGSHLWSVLLDASLASTLAQEGNLEAARGLLAGRTDEIRDVRSHGRHALYFSACNVNLAAGEFSKALEFADVLMELGEQQTLV